MNKIVVTGGNGQLASCIKDVVLQYPQYNFAFKSSDELDISNRDEVHKLFEEERPIFCINCAGYTSVDKAESEPEKAIKSNVYGAHNLADACAENQVKLIHISTDFVFDGTKTVPYVEDDVVNPLGVYGETKLEGEMAIRERLREHFIIRTSWLYSEYGSNFMKTILRLGVEKEAIQIVSDQVGSPTYAGDLADTIIQIVNKNTDKYGTYHYCNQGSVSWYGFAKEILALYALDCTLVPILSEAYRTAAQRPAYSVLDQGKIETSFKLNIPEWKHSLGLAINKLKKIQVGQKMKKRV